MPSKYLLTTIPEGSCVMSRANLSRPEFLMAYEGHHFDKDWNVIYTGDFDPDDDEKWEDIRIPTRIDDFFAIFGLYVIGWPWRSITYRTATWTEWKRVQAPLAKDEKDEAKKKSREVRQIWVRTEVTPYFMLKRFAYAFRMEDVETSLGVKVDIDFTIYIVGKNPKTALIDNDDWFSELEEQVEARVRSFVGGHDFFSLLTEDKVARGNMKAYHPLFARLQKRLAETRRANAAAGITIEEPKEIGSFRDYMTSIMVKDNRTFIKQARNEGRIAQDADGLKPIKTVLGVEIVDGTIADISLSKGEEPLARKLSEIIQQDIDNEKRVSQARANAEAYAEEGRGKANALNAETDALKKRWDEVDSKYLEKEGGAAVILTSRQARAIERIAEALESKDNKLTSVVFPQMESAKTVLPVGKN